jgi:putative phosphoesterase
VRIAVVSDIHGNNTAFDAVLADLKATSPDLVVHGGDLLGSGARQGEIVDRIRDLGWPGVHGNSDEMLWDPDKLAEHLRAPALQTLRDIVFRQLRATLDSLDAQQLAWLRALPMRWTDGRLTVVHASPDTVWRSPSSEASDDDLLRTYRPLATAHVVYGHIHHPYVRRLPAFTVANSGSVSLSYDGDPRAAYALVDDDQITIRRVEYDIEREAAALVDAAFPDAAWIGEMLRKGAFVMPAG